MNTLETFFSEPNSIKPGDQNPTTQLAAQSVQTHSGLEVLPWQRQEEMRWYVLIPSDKPFEQIREEIVAHVGVSYTTYRGQKTDLNPEDLGDERIQALLEDRNCIRVDSSGEKFHTVSKAFQRFLSFWEVRPQLNFISARSMTEVLHDYRMAIQVDRRDEAEKAKTEARGLGLDALNLIFMDLEIVNSFEGPEEVLKHRLIRDVLSLSPRPAPVTDLLVQAIDSVHLRPTVGLSIEQIKSNFSRLSSDYKKLLTSEGQVRSASGLLMLTLNKGSEDPLPSISDLKIAIDLDEETARVFEGLRQERELTKNTDEQNIESTASTTSDNSQLRELYEKGSWDEILQLTSELSPVSNNIRPVVIAAKELDTLDAARTALGFIDRAEPEVIDGLARNIREIIEELRKLAPNVEINNWNEYFEYLLHNPGKDTYGIIERGKQEWSPKTFIQNPENVKTLCGHLSTDGIDLNGVLPVLYEWLSKVPDEHYSLAKPIEETLLAHLTLNDSSVPGLELLARSARRIVSSGLNKKEFCEVLDHLEYRWELSSSPNTVGWAADLVELVIDHPVPDQDRATAFYSKVFLSMAGYFSRIEKSLRFHLASLATELNIRSILPEEAPEESEEKNHTGVKIGLYSLTETALNRAQATLANAWPGLEIVISSEKHATKELENLARTASLMVVGIGSAKHAATDCIASNRPKDKETKFIKGKGSAAFISTVGTWLDNR